MSSTTRQGDFRRFWAGESTALAGTEIAELALVLTAVVSLHATAFQISMLVVARFVPYAALSLPAGVFFDRHRRRPAIVVSALGRAVLVAVVPVAWALGHLDLAVVYAAAAGTGLLAVVGDVGSQSYLPGLVGRDALAGANSRLQASYALAAAIGPGAAGVLVGALTAPVTLLLSVGGYLAAAVSFLSVRCREAAPAAARGRPVMADIREGLHAVVAHPTLRRLATQSGIFNLFENMLIAVFAAYAVRTLGISPATLGLVLSAGATGAIVGAAIAARVSVRLGGALPALRLATPLACLPPLLLVLPRQGGVITAIVMGALLCVHGAGLALFNVNSITLRQLVTPPAVLGRMNASYRLLLTVTVPIGAAAGGVVADIAGLRAALAVAVLGIALPTLWLIAPPALSPAPLTPASEGTEPSC